MQVDEPFWRKRLLNEMSKAEWESLCDGCGKCCLVKLQDEDTDEIYYTNVVCKLFNLTTCKCNSYQDRHRLVKDCIKISHDNIGDLDWMPDTCAYRLISQGDKLFDWHPLVSGNADSVKEANISVYNKNIIYLNGENMEYCFCNFITNYFYIKNNNLFKKKYI